MSENGIIGTASAALLALALAAAGCTAPGDVAAAKPDTGVFASPGKVTAPVEMSYVLAHRPAVGQPVRIELVFTATADTSAVDVSLNVEEALSLAGGIQSLRLEGWALGAGEQRAHAIEVVAARPGLHYVNVIAEVESASRRLVRTFAVPVQVGEARQRKSAGTPSTDRDGEPLVILPAVETVRPDGGSP